MLVVHVHHAGQSVGVRDVRGLQRCVPLTCRCTRGGTVIMRSSRWARMVARSSAEMMEASSSCARHDTTQLTWNAPPLRHAARHSATDITVAPHDVLEVRRRLQPGGIGVRVRARQLQQRHHESRRALQIPERAASCGGGKRGWGVSKSMNRGDDAPNSAAPHNPRP